VGVKKTNKVLNHRATAASNSCELFKEAENMNSIMTTYPGFQSLPKGVKQMLLVSEVHFSKAARMASAHAVLERADSERYWTPRTIRTIDVLLYGTCGELGKQNQLLPTLTA